MQQSLEVQTVGLVLGPGVWCLVLGVWVLLFHIIHPTHRSHPAISMSIHVSYIRSQTTPTRTTTSFTKHSALYSYPRRRSQRFPQSLSTYLSLCVSHTSCSLSLTLQVRCAFQLQELASSGSLPERISSFPTH